VPGERLYIYISSIKERGFKRTKFWALIVDDCTDYCWSFVMKYKLNLNAKNKTVCTDLKIAGLNIRNIRCNDAGESMTMKMIQRSNLLELRLNFLALELLKETEKLEENS
jgi:hypothetical protein